MLASLRERRPIETKLAIVVAHPDDETVGAGGSLYLLRNLLMVHVTDGAPRHLGDFAREGFATPAHYAAAREAELAAALSLSGAAPRRESLGVPDQEASLAMPEIAAKLRELFRLHQIQAVLTHAYEGGHPDHDAVALAVHRTGCEVFEFAGYHARPGGTLLTGAFLPGPPEVAVTLSPQDAARKSSMLNCFRTQAEILSQFDRTTERFRNAPAYDFAAPPHPGPLNYENWGWSMTGVEWRQLAAMMQCAA